MKRPLLIIAALLLAPALLLTYPSVFPTGTTVFHPDKTWSGYTVFDTPGEGGTALIDMNGNLLKRWTEVAAVPGPFRILPGGYVMGGTNRRRPHQEAPELIQVNWDGEIVWKFDCTELVLEEEEEEEEDDGEDDEDGGEPTWMARQHHDWQREGSPVGYYAPDAEPLVDRGRTLILAHRNVLKPEISDKLLEDDYILEVSWDGDILWDWLASDHLDELDFSEEARNTLHRFPNWNEERGSSDWLHINAMAYVDPNRTNRIFRAHRVPYDWVPQLERPTETAVIPPPNEEFRVPPQ